MAKNDNGVLRRPNVPRLASAPARATRSMAGLPSFLQRKDPEDRLERAIRTGRVWCEAGEPVEIRGFDARADVLSLVFDGADRLPDLSLQKDSETGATLLLADGKPVVILHGVDPCFSLRNVALTRFAA